MDRRVGRKERSWGQEEVAQGVRHGMRKLTGTD